MSVFSYEMLVNRTHRLESGFLPPSLVCPAIPFDALPDDPKRMLEERAARAAEKLFAHAAEDGMSLTAISGYRPYSRQEELFRNAADPQYVAPPGASEHQTGLALDLSCAAADFDLTDAFASTAEGLWITRNAHLHGFILRYPKGKEKITGYAWEPWHIRYVTRSLAFYLALTGLTLEEYHLYDPTAPSAAP